MGVVPLLVLESFLEFGFDALVRTTSGGLGLVIVFVYSFLIAFALPGVSEVVLATPLDLTPAWLKFSVIILVSGLGKAAGSVFAFHIGQVGKEAAVESGRIMGWLERRGIDIQAWSRARAVELAQRWGYGGLAVALSVPTFPDTISIYAFAVLEEDYLKFALATFAGSVGRLLVTLVGIKAFLVFA